MSLLLDSAKSHNPLLIRRASILALGEASLVDAKLLADWMASPLAEIRETGLLAALMSGTPEARKLVDAITLDEQHALRGTARRLADFAVDPSGAEESASTRDYLEWRFEAAKQFGLIDGQSWSVRVLNDVLKDEAFLDSVVFPASARLLSTGVKDHLMHSLLEEGGRARVQAATLAMPKAISSLVEHELWLPNDDEEWSALLDVIWDNRLETRVGAILVRALDVPSMRMRASASIARLKDKEAASVLLPGVLHTEGTSPQDRSWAIEFLVELADEDSLKHIRSYLADESRAVRAKARVALVRMNVPIAAEELYELVADSGDSDREVILRELCSQARSNSASKLLQELLLNDVLNLEQRIRVGSNLILNGRGVPPASFSEDILKLPISGELGALTLRALGKRGLTDDLELLVRHFPTEGDQVVNLAAASALIERGTPGTIPILQAAIWRGPWDRSILACALLVDTVGFRALADELNKPPTKATSEDLRRVGFALGELGGIEQVEAFARRLQTGTGDPILQGAVLGALSARTH